MEVNIQVTLNIDPFDEDETGAPLHLIPDDLIESANKAILNAVEKGHDEGFNHPLQDYSSIKIISVRSITHRRPV